MKRFLLKKILLLSFFLLVSLSVKGQTTVTYTMQTAQFPTRFTDGNSGFFDAGAATLGFYAKDSGNKQAVAWRTFKTIGNGTDNTSNLRSLQVGDVFIITVSCTRAFGQVGFSLNAGGTLGSSYANRTSGSRLFINTDNYGQWYVNRNGGATVLGSGYNPIQSTYKDYRFTVRITSTTTADVFMTVDGTDYRAFNLTMNGSANIDSFSVYGADMWDGDSNDDGFWKQTATVTNTSTVQLGYFLTSGTYTPGLIRNGLDAASTSTPSVNNVLVGGDSGTFVILNQPNTYSGTTTVNTNARLELQNAQALGTTTGVTVQNNAALSLFGGVSYNSYITNLNGTGVAGANGALRSTGGNNTWPGAITLGSSSRINADTSGAAGSLTLSGPIGIGANNLTVGGSNANVTISNAITGSGGLTKDGTNTLFLSGTNNYSGTTLVSNGLIEVNSGGVLGNGTSNLVVLALNGQLKLNTNATVAMVRENGTGDGGTINLNGNTLTLSGSTGTFFQNSISGNGSLVKNGLGTLSLYGTQSYGSTTVNGGSVVVPYTGYTTTVTSSGITVAFSPAPVSGIYPALPGALLSTATLSTTGLGVGQTASFNPTTGQITVNDAPVVDLNAGSAGINVTTAFTEQTAVQIASLATVTDGDSANMSSLVATLVARPDGNAVESLSLNGSATTAAAGLTVSYTPSTGVLSITGSATKAIYQTILQGILYNNTSDTPTTTNRSITVVANDGAAPSATSTVTLTVAAVNDAPVNTVPATQSVNEDTSLVFSSGNGNTISVSDVDAAAGNLQVTLTSTNGVITLSGFTGLTFTVGDGTSDATMTFSGTITNLNAALNGLTFAPTSNFNGSGSIQIVTSDLGNTGSGGVKTDTDTVTVTVNGISETPTITGTYCVGGTTVSGTSSDANGTAIIVYKAGSTSIGSATVSGGNWTATVSALSANDVLTAVATATGEALSAASPGVTVNALPIVSNPPSILCVNETFILSPTSGGTWSSSNPTKVSITNGGLITALDVALLTAESFTFTNSSTGCSSTTTGVNVNPNVTYYQDFDGDGFGNPAVSQITCTGAPIGYVTNNSDCNDAQLQFTDNDGDGFGVLPLVACGVTNQSDCNDTVTYYTDSDGDGFGTLPKVACGSVTNGTDCNDGDISTWRNGVFYADADGDNYSPTPTTTQTLCYGNTEPVGFSFVINSQVDCNDAVAGINPGATEICYNNVDDNCNGTKSEFCPAVPVTVVNPGTITNFSNSLSCLPYTYAGATSIAYRIEIERFNNGVTTGQLVTLPTQSSRFFFIPTNMRSFTNNGITVTYKIRASAVINGEEVAYALPTITVNSYAIPKVKLTSCPTALSSIGATISANPGFNAQDYTFRIRLTSDNPTFPATPTYYYITNSASRFVNSNSFSGLQLQYGTSYQVSVNYRLSNNGNTEESGWGDECTMTTPTIPVVSIASPVCGTQVTSIGAGISAYPATYADRYRFRIRLTSEDPNTATYYTTAELTSRFTNLSAFGTTLAYNTSYSISVQYRLSNNGNPWSAFGAECAITTPFFPTVDITCNPGITSLTQSISFGSYIGFPTYKIRLIELDSNLDPIPSSVQYITRTYTNFTLSMFTTHPPVVGKNYNADVAIILNGIDTEYGRACTILTVAPLRPGAAIKQTFTATAYPNPFANNFLLDVKSSSTSMVNVKVYDMLGRLIEQRDANVADMATTTIGERYPSGVYNVVVSQEDNVQTVRVVKR